MALTRTKFIQSDTTKAKLQDPITLLNSDSTVANVDVGFLVNRNLGVKSNVALVWSESGNTFVVAFTDDTGITNSNLIVSSYANVVAGTITVTSLKTDNFLYSNGNPYSAPAASYASTFVADNLSSGNAVFATARITGNLQVEGNIFTIGQQNLSISDAVIDLHTQANLAPWTFNDGKDIGLKFHYYDYQDEHAFLGRANDSGYLEWYDSGREVGNVFTGNTYGTIKSGELLIANATVSSNNTTGALRVSGGAGIEGRLNVGGNIVANAGTASSSTTTGAMVVRGGMGVSGDTYIGGALTAGGLQNTAIGTVIPNSGYFNDLNNTLTLKSGGNVVAYSGTASTNTTSGAVVVVGGAGISGAINSGSTITAGGNIVAAAGTSSTNTTSGALVVVGGAGVSGNIYSDSLYTSGLYWAGNNVPIGGPSTGLDGAIQYNNGGTLGGTNIIYDDATGNIVFTDTTTSTSTTTGAVVLAGGMGVAGNIFAGGLNGTIYGTLFIGTTDVNYNRSSGSQVLSGVGINGTATTATNAINTQITSNISAGTAYVTFVNAASGNVAQNVGTALTFNPSTGNLRTFAAAVDTTLIINNTGDVSANLGSYQVFANANVSSLQNQITGANTNIQTTSANLGSFQTYANTKIGTNTNSNLVVVATTAATSTTTGALVVGGGVGISGNVTHGGIQQRITAGGISSPSARFAINTGTKLDMHVATSVGGVSATNTQQYGISFTNGSGQTQAALVCSENGSDGTSLGFFCTNSYATGPQLAAFIDPTRNFLPGANVSLNLGSTTAWWNIVYGKAVQAQYADLAENYTADVDYSAGTVVVFGGQNEITISNISHDSRVAGVVSTNPAYLMNAAQGNVSVALTGRVPTLVRGPIFKGALVVTSEEPGVGQACNLILYTPGCVIGKSLEEIPDASIKLIEVVVGRF
jgi:hypothetical protein